MNFGNKRQISIGLLGITLIVSTVYFDKLWNHLFLYSIFIPGVLFIGVTGCLLIAAIKADYISIFICLISILLAIGVNIIDWNWFKSPKILEAELISDLSRINMTLRENNDFEIISGTMLGTTQKYSGKFKLVNNKILFLSKPYDNDLIPDTVTIIKDKIILNSARNGNPNNDFVSFFKIKLNKIYNYRH